MQAREGGAREGTPLAGRRTAAGLARIPGIQRISDFFTEFLEFLEFSKTYNLLYFLRFVQGAYSDVTSILLRLY